MFVVFCFPPLQTHFSKQINKSEILQFICHEPISFRLWNRDKSGLVVGLFLSVCLFVCLLAFVFLKDGISKPLGKVLLFNLAAPYLSSPGRASQQ